MKNLMNKLKIKIIHRLGGVTESEFVQRMHDTKRVPKYRSETHNIQTLVCKEKFELYFNQTNFIEDFKKTIAQKMADKLYESDVILFDLYKEDIGTMMELCGTLKIVMPEVSAYAKDRQPDDWRTV